MIPRLVVTHVGPGKILECESCYIVRQAVLREYLSPNLEDVMLILDHSHNHVLKNEVSLSAVGVCSCHVFISQRVVTIIELSYVAPEVLGYGKLTTWMNLFIPLGPKN